MGIVLASHSVSLDGFIAQRNGRAGPLHEWLSTGEHQSRHGDNFKLSDTSRDVFDGLIDRLGATIVGRKTYDDSDGWGGELPFEWPYFIVAHEPPANADEVPFTFVTEGVERAVELAMAAAGEKDVSLMGGDIVGQVVSAGLLDEIDIDIVPLGDGVRLLD
ncbi:MAG: hypothetical protein H0U30_02755 [Actinobacteria bacterium]|nr:hypothetical protein [Actinomycetota bacterium]